MVRTASKSTRLFLVAADDGPGGRLEPLGRRAEAGPAQVGDLAAEEPDLVARGAA